MRLISLLIKRLPTPSLDIPAAVEGLPQPEVVKTILSYSPQNESRVESTVASMMYATVLSLLPRPLEPIHWLAKTQDPVWRCQL